MDGLAAGIALVSTLGLLVAAPVLLFPEFCATVYLGEKYRDSWEYAVGAATVGVSWSRYVMSFFHDFGIHFPAQLAASPFEPVTLPERLKSPST